MENLKAKFMAYEAVRKSGKTNMFAVNKVCKLAEKMTETILVPSDCFFIMKNYKALSEEYLTPRV